MAKQRCRVGIDVGGTFTDFVLANMATGELTRYKEPSVPADPSKSVERGLPPLMELAGVEPESVELIVHGTTLLVNTIIQRKGAKVALVVSKGHRGILEIGRARLANSYDFTVQKEEPLVKRNLIYETESRTMADGTIIGRPAKGELKAVAEQILAQDIEAVTILLLHSYAHPEMEQHVAQELRKRLGKIPVTESAHIWPERREFERSLIAIMNAYVNPLMTAYLDLLIKRVESLKIKAPIYITANNGGTLSIDTARDRPIDTILSGPASGVVAATQAAAMTGNKRLITVDMGGTSCDVAVTQGGEPEYTTQTHVGDFPLVLPVVNVSAIGAGGGSIIWVDPQGVLKVGPQSAGADPGPVCYGQGGTQATVTDCYLLTGFIHPDHFLGGRMKLDRKGAVKALDEVAKKIGIKGPDRAVKAAEAALQVTTAIMSTELYKGLAQRGEDPRDFTLMAYGGAGPTQGNLLAQEARLTQIIVPPAPSVFCAMGAILADVKRDYVRSHHLKFRREQERDQEPGHHLPHPGEGCQGLDQDRGQASRQGGVHGDGRHALRWSGLRLAGRHRRQPAPQAHRRGPVGAVPYRAREDLWLPRPGKRRRGDHRTGPGDGQDPAHHHAQDQEKERDQGSRTARRLLRRQVPQSARLPSPRPRCRRCHQGSRHRRTVGLDHRDHPKMVGQG